MSDKGKSYGGHLQVEIVELDQVLQALVARDLGDGGPLHAGPPHGLDRSHPEDRSQGNVVYTGWFLKLEPP